MITIHPFLMDRYFSEFMGAWGSAAPNFWASAAKIRPTMPRIFA